VTLCLTDGCLLECSRQNNVLVGVNATDGKERLCGHCDVHIVLHMSIHGIATDECVTITSFGDWNTLCTSPGQTSCIHVCE